MVLTMHSFTPYWRGSRGPGRSGSCTTGTSASPGRSSSALEDDPAGLTVGDNEPYGGGLPYETIDRHATARGLANALVEIRQDLIAGETGQAEWAERFARVLRPLLTVDLRPAGHEIRTCRPTPTRAGPMTRSTADPDRIEAAVFRRLVAHLRGRTECIRST